MNSQWIVKPTPNATIASRASNTSNSILRHLRFRVRAYNERKRSDGYAASPSLS
jgi:hypothetical protein